MKIRTRLPTEKQQQKAGWSLHPIRERCKDSTHLHRNDLGGEAKAREWSLHMTDGRRPCKCGGCCCAVEADLSENRTQASR